MPQSDKVQVTFRVETRTTAEVRDAALPEGSVVATHREAYIKSHPTLVLQWRGTNGGRYGSEAIDRELAMGARVLRVGNDKEET